MSDHGKKVLWAAWQSFRHMRAEVHKKCFEASKLAGVPCAHEEACPICGRLARLDTDMQLIAGGHEPTHATPEDLT